MTNSSHDDILKEDLDWYKKFHAMKVTGLCDSGCGRLATTWFGNTSAATCGDKVCVDEQQREYDDH